MTISLLVHRFRIIEQKLRKLFEPGIFEGAPTQRDNNHKLYPGHILDFIFSGF